MAFWGYERRARIKVKDGIQARSGKGDFAKGWWARRWIATLETFGWDNRLSRGRSYARSGQVMDYQLAPGKVTARVQGSRPKPYNVTIHLAAWGDAAWQNIFDSLAKQALFAAKLLAGDMPEDIEEPFAAAGTALLPTQAKDLRMECSCPDGAVPCKHLAAVHYIMAEAFDEDPFLIFALRGRDREAVLDALRQRRGATDESAAVVPPPATQLLPLDATSFWRAAPLPPQFDVGMEPPRLRHSLFTRLGAPGKWTRSAEFIEVLGPVLERLSGMALRAALGEEDKSLEQSSLDRPGQAKNSEVPRRGRPRKSAQPVTPGPPREELVPPVVARRRGRPRKEAASPQAVPTPLIQTNTEVAPKRKPRQRSRRR